MRLAGAGELKKRIYYFKKKKSSEKQTLDRAEVKRKIGDGV